METKKISPAQLTEETSLYQLYRLSSKFPKKRFNRYSTVVVGFVTLVYALWTVRSGGEVGSIAKEILKLGIALVPSVLGFLIAGFTVFVTVTKPGVFSAMARREFKDTGQSYLKYNLSAFMLAFAHYVAYLSVCVLLVFFGQPNGPITQLTHFFADRVFSNVSNAYGYIVSLYVIVLSCWTWYLVMLLKSFINNVYQVVVTSVRWDLEDEDRRSKSLGTQSTKSN